MKDAIRGAFAPVPTPVGDDGRFEPLAMKRHLNWLATTGLDGVLVLGTNGEFPSFSVAERRRIAETAAATGSRLRLLLGVGSCSVVEVVEMACVAAELGFEAVLCPPPYYYRAAAVAGIAEFLSTVLDASPLPVLLYHIPQVTGVPIGDELLDALGDHRRLAGVKDSSADIEEMTRLVARFARGSYLVGTDRLVGACLEVGGAGSISAAASVVPDLVAEVVQHPERQPELTEVRALLEEFGLGASVKCILRNMGLGRYAFRPPLVGLDTRTEAELLRRFTELAGSLPRPE